MDLRQRSIISLVANWHKKIGGGECTRCVPSSQKIGTCLKHPIPNSKAHQSNLRPAYVSSVHCVPLLTLYFRRLSGAASREKERVPKFLSVKGQSATRRAAFEEPQASSLTSTNSQGGCLARFRSRCVHGRRRSGVLRLRVEVGAGAQRPQPARPGTIQAANFLQQ